jgi:beta-carotene 3-hydroxylase
VSYLLLFAVTVLGMEVFAYAMHRWVMHGPGWFLHASHHRARHGRFELNDLYAVIFAAPSIALIYAGVQGTWGPAATSVGAGIAAYGLIYFVFHDAIVHKRLANRYVPASAYMKRIVQAHRLHHAAESKHGSVSFGFIYAPPVAELKRQLRANSGDLRFRAAAGAAVEAGVE